MHFASQILTIRAEFRKAGFYLHGMTLILPSLLTRLEERVDHVFMQNPLA